jgi:hypothetical protein
MVEAGRIDHAHHEGNAFRAITDAEELDRAVGAAASLVDLRDTLIVVTADHSHVFNIAGYPMRPRSEVPYPLLSFDPGYASLAGNGILDVVYDVNPITGHVEPSKDAKGQPYTALVYGNGPGYRGVPRVDPRLDPFPGRGGVVPQGRDPRGGGCRHLRGGRRRGAGPGHRQEHLRVRSHGQGAGIPLLTSGAAKRTPLTGRARGTPTGPALRAEMEES